MYGLPDRVDLPEVEPRNLTEVTQKHRKTEKRGNLLSETFCADLQLALGAVSRVKTINEIAPLPVPLLP
jgi:hypothetical protein